MNQPASAGAVPLTPPLIPCPSANGRRPDRSSWAPRPAPSRSGRPRRRLAAALALLLLALTSAALFAERREPGGGGNLPAAAGSPIAAPTPDPQTAIGTLVDATTAGGLSGPGKYVSIEIASFSADGSYLVDNLFKSNVVLLVLTGQVTATVSTPSQLHTGLGAPSAQAVAAGAPQLLRAGDALAIAGTGSILRVDHQGAVPAVVLSLNAYDDNVNGPEESGAVMGPFVANTFDFSGAPLHFVLRRVSLAPQQTAPAPAAGTIQLVAPDGPPGTAKLQTSAAGAVTNRDAKPVALLILTLTQGGGGGTATPTAASPAS